MKKTLLLALVLAASTVSLSARADDVADGKALFDAKGCAACHAVTPGATSVGPNMIGTITRRGTEAAIAQQIVKPVMSPTAAAVMPEGLATAEEAAKIAKYIATLK